MSYQALLFCPDEKTARTVAQVLTELEFSVETAADPFAAVKKLMAQHFDAIVVDCENEQNASLIFKSARNSSSNQSSLSVAVVEGQAGVAKAFRIGANLVLTKPINIEQSKGTLRVARGLLRKGAEGAKNQVSAGVGPAASSGALGPASAEAKSVPAFPSPKFDSARAVPVASAPSGAFEQEPESRPKLDPTEAAVLESMPNTVPDSIADQSSKTASSKSYPWQPSPKTGAGPMAAALQKAAEAAGKTLPGEGHKAGKASPSFTSSGTKQSAKPAAVAGKASGQGAASAPAPAPAKESSQVSDIDSLPSVAAPRTKRGADSEPQLAAKADAAATVAEAPSFGMDANEAEPSERNKRPLVAAVVVLIIAAAAYFGWTTLHGKVSQPAARPVPAQSVPAPEPQVTTAPVAADVTPNQTSESMTAVTASAPSTAKSSAAMSPKSLSSGPIAEDKTVRIEEAQPMIVKSEGARRPAPGPEAEAEAEAPNALGISDESNSAVKDLSNVVPSVPVSVPRPVAQVVNISQGVSQGLILKKVQPNYPSQALAMHIQGPVELQAMISKTGNITNVSLVSGQPLLARAAADAVRQWKYKPYYLNGQPVEVQTQITVNFRLPN